MSNDFVMRKTASFALFLILLLSSCSPHRNQWKLAVIKGTCPCATYSKAYLPTCNTFNGLEAVFVSYNGGLCLYLNAFTFLFPCTGDEGCQSEICIEIASQSYSFIAERLEGGQTLLLPEESMQLIIGALLEKKCIEITVGRFEATLTFDNFEKSYRSLTCKGQS